MKARMCRDSAHLAITFCCCKNSAEGLTSKTHERDGVDPPYSAASCHSVVVIKSATSREDVRRAHYHNRHCSRRSSRSGAPRGNPSGAVHHNCHVKGQAVAFSIVTPLAACCNVGRPHNITNQTSQRFS